MLGAWALIGKMSKPVFKRKEEAQAQGAQVEGLDLSLSVALTPGGGGECGLLGQSGQGAARWSRVPLGGSHQGVQVVS